jgi:hypothetical protein
MLFVSEPFSNFVGRMRSSMNFSERNTGNQLPSCLTIQSNISRFALGLLRNRPSRLTTDLTESLKAASWNASSISQTYIWYSDSKYEVLSYDLSHVPLTHGFIKIFDMEKCRFPYRNNDYHLLLASSSVNQQLIISWSFANGLSMVWQSPAHRVPMACQLDADRLPIFCESSVECFLIPCQWPINGLAMACSWTVNLLLINSWSGVDRLLSHCQWPITGMAIACSSAANRLTKVGQWPDDRLPVSCWSTVDHQFGASKQRFLDKHVCKVGLSHSGGKIRIQKEWGSFSLFLLEIWTRGKWSQKVNFMRSGLSFERARSRHRMGMALFKKLAPRKRSFLRCSPSQKAHAK